MSRNIQRNAAGQKPQVRTPQPSIKSSQIFTQQQPKGKNTQQPQRNYQQQSYQQDTDYQDDMNRKGNNITKMTIAQAITLITLRLGSLETKMMRVDTNPNPNESFNSLDDTNISSRLDALENKFNSSITTDYKQQIDQLMQTIIQQKNASTAIAKDNKEIKNQLNSLKREILEMNQLIETVRTTVMSNESKIFELLNTDIQYDEVLEANDINIHEDLEFNLSEDDESNDTPKSGLENLEHLNASDTLEH
jgi:hypothetical protein